MSKYTVYRNDRGKPCGSLRPGGVVQVTRSRSRHLLRYPVESWCEGVKQLRDAERQGYDQTFQVDETETGDRYTIPLATAWAVGKIINRGYGDQLAIPVSAFSKNGQPPARPANRPKLPAPEASQLSFLG